MKAFLVCLVILGTFVAVMLARASRDDDRPRFPQHSGDCPCDDCNDEMWGY